MAAQMTLDEVEQLAAQLGPQEQIRLIARISGRLSDTGVPHGPRLQSTADHSARMRSFVKMAEEMAASASGVVDSARDIRQMRAERGNSL